MSESHSANGDLTQLKSDVRQNLKLTNIIDKYRYFDVFLTKKRLEIYLKLTNWKLVRFNAKKYLKKVGIFKAGNYLKKTGLAGSLYLIESINFSADLLFINQLFVMAILRLIGKLNLYCWYKGSFNYDIQSLVVWYLLR